MIRMLFFTLSLLPALSGTALGITFGEAFKELNPTSKYFIYIHGEELEGGAKGVETRYGTYEYEKIINTLGKQGLTVISETRPRVSPLQYAGSIVSKIRRMIGAGVPPVNITVCGFGRGGYITLLVGGVFPQRPVCKLCGHGRMRPGQEQRRVQPVPAPQTGTPPPGPNPFPVCRLGPGSRFLQSSL